MRQTARPLRPDISAACFVIVDEEHKMGHPDDAVVVYNLSRSKQHSH